MREPLLLGARRKPDRLLDNPSPLVRTGPETGSRSRLWPRCSDAGGSHLRRLGDRRTRTGFAPRTVPRSGAVWDARPRPEHRPLPEDENSRWRPIFALRASTRPVTSGRHHRRRVSLAMIPGTQWHNPMKAPPCMRWRGLHLAFAAKTARFLGRFFTSRPFTETSNHLKCQLPDTPPRNHVPARFLPQFRSLLGGLPSR